METQNTKKKSRGRPKLDRKKERRLALRLSSAEYLIVSEKSQEAGLRISSYLRRAALFSKIHSGISIPQMQLIRQLAGMANNINQVAKLCHQEGILSGLTYFENYRKALDEILQKMKST